MGNVAVLADTPSRNYATSASFGNLGPTGVGELATLVALPE